MECLPDHTGSKRGLRTETDLGAFLVAILTNAIGITLLNRAYVTKYKEINQYVQRYSKCKLPSMTQDKASNLTRKIHLIYLTKSLILFLLAFVIAYFSNKNTIENYKIYFGIDSAGKEYLYYILLILFWISNIYVFASPVHFGTDMMSTCFLRSLAYLYNVWQVEMKSRRSSTKDPQNDQGLEDILNLGFYLSNLTRLLNTILSPFLFIDMIVLSTSTVMWCYNGFAFFGNLGKFEEIMIPLVYCLTSFGFVCMYVQRLWNKCNDSQMLSDAIEASAKELSIDLLANYHKLDKRLKWKSDVLEERLVKEHPIRPFDFFTMNRSAFLPTLASALTYFIIIIQFKLSESNLDTVSTNITVNSNVSLNVQ